MAHKTKPTQEIKPRLVISSEAEVIEALAKEKAARLNESINKSRQFEAAKRHARWQSIADELWATNPHLSKSDVARRIAKKTGDLFSTIRHVIRKK
jgi:hypothetical protein